MGIPALVLMDQHLTTYEKNPLVGMLVHLMACSYTEPHTMGNLRIPDNLIGMVGGIQSTQKKHMHHQEYFTQEVGRI